MSLEGTFLAEKLALEITDLITYLNQLQSENLQQNQMPYIINRIHDLINYLKQLQSENLQSENLQIKSLQQWKTILTSLLVDYINQLNQLQLQSENLQSSEDIPIQLSTLLKLIEQRLIWLLSKLTTDLNQLNELQLQSENLQSSQSSQSLTKRIDLLEKKIEKRENMSTYRKSGKLLVSVLNFVL